MDKETFKARFVNYSNEDLILMVSKNSSKYNPDAVSAGKEILLERNIDVERIISLEKVSAVIPEEEFSNDDYERQYIESLSPLDQIKYLSERRVDFEENIEEIIESNNENLTDEEILINFENILDTIQDNGSFGDLTAIHSKENYFLTSNIIEQKKIVIPSSLTMKIDFANMLAVKDFRKKFNKNIFFGLFFLTFGLVFTIGTGGNIIMYGAVLTGIGFLFRGIRGRIRLKNGSQNLLDAYN